jgi:hypothetical protein
MCHQKRVFSAQMQRYEFDHVKGVFREDVAFQAQDGGHVAEVERFDCKWGHERAFIVLSRARLLLYHKAIKTLGCVAETGRHRHTPRIVQEYKFTEW